MTKDVIDELNKENVELSPFHDKMLREAKNLVKTSRSKLATRYDDWDLQDRVYRGEMAADTDDLEQARKGKPSKMVVPNTNAQVMTFASFQFLTFMQNGRIFELAPTAPSAYGQLRDDCETFLDRDMRYNAQAYLMFQNLLDIGRFGPGIMECSWTRKISKIYAPQESTMTTVLGATIESNPGSDWQDVLKYEGNLVRNVSPYKFFYDTRHPLTDFQKGEFCAAEEEYSRGALYELESAGEVAGIEWIQPLNSDWMDTRGNTRLSFDVSASSYTAGYQNKSKNSPVVVTKMQRWVVPSKYVVDDTGAKPKYLGPETFPVLYHIWYANDNRLIRCEPCRWWHNEFGWTVSQFTPDMHHDLSLGLADLVYRLQDVISWFINSRIRDVRRNVFGRNVVDPRIIDTKTLDGEGDIYLRKGMSTPIDRAIFPLPMNNVTQGHMGDAEMLTQIMQAVTGVNDNMQGQVNSGRRSAREVGIAAGGAGGRMKLHGQLIWESGWGRLGKMMLSNSRQSLSQDSFEAVLGQDPMRQQQQQSHAPDPSAGPSITDRFAAYKSTPKAIAMGADFFIFDSTTPSEKSFLAQNLQQLLEAVLGNPQAAVMLDVDPKSLLDEVQQLRGSGPMKRFSIAMSSDPVMKAQWQQILSPPPPQPPPPKPLAEQLQMKLADLVGIERTQALALVGIQADPAAHNAKLTLENQTPTNAPTQQ